jgi:hypothetical protein
LFSSKKQQSDIFYSITFIIFAVVMSELFSCDRKNYFGNNLQYILYDLFISATTLFFALFFLSMLWLMLDWVATWLLQAGCWNCYAWFCGWFLLGRRRVLCICWWCNCWEGFDGYSSGV